jgi:hypothetical protein
MGSFGEGGHRSYQSSVRFSSFVLINIDSNSQATRTSCRYDAGINTFDTANVGQLNLSYPFIHTFQSVLGVLQWPLRSDPGESY